VQNKHLELYRRRCSTRFTVVSKPTFTSHLRKRAMAAAGPEEDSHVVEPSAPVLTRASLMQRTIDSWTRFVRKSIVEAADGSKTEQVFEMFGSGYLTVAQNIALKTRFAKIVLDIANEGELTVTQKVTIDEETTVQRVQKTDDIVFVEGRKLVLTVSWAD